MIVIDTDAYSLKEYIGVDVQAESRIQIVEYVSVIISSDLTEGVVAYMHRPGDLPGRVHTYSLSSEQVRKLMVFVLKLASRAGLLEQITELMQKGGERRG